MSDITQSPSIDSKSPSPSSASTKQRKELMAKGNMHGEDAPESSEASFKSPSSTDDTASLSTQPPNIDNKSMKTLTQTELNVKVKVEPKSLPVKRVITYDFNVRVEKKQKKCCGRCSEFAGICKSLATNANDQLKAKYQYNVNPKNKKYRAIFYNTFEKVASVDVIPTCVLEFARKLYPSPFPE